MKKSTVLLRILLWIFAVLFSLIIVGGICTAPAVAGQAKDELLNKLVIVLFFVFLELGIVFELLYSYMNNFREKLALKKWQHILLWVAVIVLGTIFATIPPRFYSEGYKLAVEEYNKTNRKDQGESNRSDNPVEDTENVYVLFSLSADTIQNSDDDELVELLSGMGFVDIDIEEMVDLDPDEGITRFHQLFDGNELMEEGQEYSKRDHIRVVCHKCYEKYNVVLGFDFVKNLLFSKYDVDVNIDGEKQFTLNHGEGISKELRLKAGEHTIDFCGKKDKLVTSVTIVVDSDLTKSYKISCKKDEIKVDDMTPENIAENGGDPSDMAIEDEPVEISQNFKKLSDEQYIELTGLLAKCFYSFVLDDSDIEMIEKDEELKNCLNDVLDYAASNYFELEPSYKELFKDHYDQIASEQYYNKLCENFAIEYNVIKKAHTIASYTVNPDDAYLTDDIISYIDAEGYLDRDVVVYWEENGKM